MNEHPLWYLAVCARATGAWMQGAHHAVSGESSAADHALIYGRVYDALHWTADNLLERAIGLTNLPSIASPLPILRAMVDKFSELGWPDPAVLSASDLAVAAQAINAEFIASIGRTLNTMKIDGTLSTGTENMLAGLADEHERYAYKLGRRANIGLRPVMASPASA